MLKTRSLTPDRINVIRNHGTEAPFSGGFDRHNERGTYLCRQCGLALFRSHNKFDAGCGWPAFDDEIINTVLKTPDPDGRRTEISCARCKGHLGHIFQGERHTPKNQRYCVNSLSLDFVSDLNVADTEEGIFAGGCFWGVEYLFKKLAGIMLVESGYIGGKISNPSYEQVCSGATGYLEAVRVVFDSTKTNFETVAQHFFEIHDPTQIDGQGPDTGQQYLSAAFYYNEHQQNTLKHLINLLQSNGFTIATKLLPVNTFWPAEDYHQRYYEKHHKEPYCHRYVKRF